MDNIKKFMDFAFDYAGQKQMAHKIDGVAFAHLMSAAVEYDANLTGALAVSEPVVAPAPAPAPAPATAAAAKKTKAAKEPATAPEPEGPSWT